jgi:hypothetical protein
VHDDENDDSLNRTDCVPSLLTVCDTLDERHTPGIIEDASSCFKVDTVLRLVDFVFRLISFDSHPYLQYSPYDFVKAGQVSAPGT